MIKDPVRLAVSVALFVLAIGLGSVSTAGAAIKPTVGKGASVTLSINISGTGAGYPSGVTPLYGINHCSSFTHHTTGVKVCIDLKSATKLTWTAQITYGTTFNGHEHVTGVNVTINDPSSGSHTFRTATPPFGTSVTKALGTHVYCNTLWKNTGSSYANWGSVCT